MTKEGIKFGDSLTVATVTIDSPVSSETKLLSPDGSRVGFSIAPCWASNDTGTGTVRLYSSKTNFKAPFATLTEGSGSRFFSREDFGSIITGEVWVNQDQENPMPIGVTVMRMTGSL